MVSAVVQQSPVAWLLPFWDDQPFRCVNSVRAQRKTSSGHTASAGKRWDCKRLTLPHDVLPKRLGGSQPINRAARAQSGRRDEAHRICCVAKLPATADSKPLSVVSLEDGVFEGCFVLKEVVAPRCQQFSNSTAACGQAGTWRSQFKKLRSLQVKYNRSPWADPRTCTTAG